MGVDINTYPFEKSDGEIEFGPFSGTAVEFRSL